MVVIVSCDACGLPITRSPSKVNPRNFCDFRCYSLVCGNELEERGKKSRFTKGHKKNIPEHYKNLAKLLSNDGHPKWKGDKVSYRGLHQWVRRKKGIPLRCLHCGKKRTGPRSIQWANIDHKYRRVLEDYIPLCSKCHGKYDSNLRGTL